MSGWGPLSPASGDVLFLTSAEGNAAYAPKTTIPLITTHWPGASMTAGTKLAIMGSTNTETVGIHFTRNITFTRVSVCGNCGANTGTPAFTVTLWNANQTAGSEIITTSNATAATTGFQAESTTIVNSGKNIVAAGTRVILTAVLVGGTSAGISQVGILVEGSYT